MVYYFDASALVKRYAQESGTSWVIGLCASLSDHTIATARITKAEVAAAFAAKHRSGGLATEDYGLVMKALGTDFSSEYTLVEISSSVVDLAVALIQRRKLRGYDAVQLASGITLNNLLLQSNLPALIFICADNDLLSAARSEGLAVDNPNAHPNP